MARNLSSIQSTPPHPKGNAGICLIVGTHPDWDKDFDAAHQSAYEKDLVISAVCAINDATALVNAEHLATCHVENLDQFLSHVDGNIQIHTRKKLKQYEKHENHYTWPYSYGGASALFAAATMIAIGYEKVVLCGCPMNGGDGYAVKFHDGSEDAPRLGEETIKSNTMDQYHHNMRKFKRQYPDDAKKIRSMSGVTKQIFGGF